MGKFFDYVEKLPVLFKQLMDSPNYKIDTLTEGRIKEILGESLPVEGVYLMCDKEVPMYVSRLKTLAQKIGIDERALGEIQATVSRKIMKDESNNFSTMKEARNYLFKNYSVKFIKIDDEVLNFICYLCSHKASNTI